MYINERDELESRGLTASDVFRPDPFEYRFLLKDCNVHRHHYDVPMFAFLTPIKTNFQAVYRRHVHWRDYAFDAIIVDTAASLVTAKAVRFALQSTLADA